jgi:hypothetical protein
MKEHAIYLYAVKKEKYYYAGGVKDITGEGAKVSI